MVLRRVCGPGMFVPEILLIAGACYDFPEMTVNVSMSLLVLGLVLCFVGLALCLSCPPKEDLSCRE